jgi:hypothetical protein
MFRSQAEKFNGDKSPASKERRPVNPELAQLTSETVEYFMSLLCGFEGGELQGGKVPKDGMFDVISNIYDLLGLDEEGAGKLNFTEISARFRTVREEEVKHQKHVGEDPGIYLHFTLQNGKEVDINLYGGIVNSEAFLYRNASSGAYIAGKDHAASVNHVVSKPTEFGMTIKQNGLDEVNTWIVVTNNNQIRLDSLFLITGNCRCQLRDPVQMAENQVPMNLRPLKTLLPKLLQCRQAHQDPRVTHEDSSFRRPASPKLAAT